MKKCSFCGKEIEPERSIYVPATGKWFCNLAHWSRWQQQNETTERDMSEDWKQDKEE